MTYSSASMPTCRLDGREREASIQMPYTSRSTVQPRGREGGEWRVKAPLAGAMREGGMRGGAETI